MAYKLDLGNGHFCYTENCKRHTPNNNLANNLNTFDKVRIQKNANLQGGLEHKLVGFFRDAFDRIDYKARQTELANYYNNDKGIEYLPNSPYFNDWYSDLVANGKNQLQLTNGGSVEVTTDRQVSDPLTGNDTALLVINGRLYTLVAEYTDEDWGDNYNFHSISDGLTTSYPDSEVR